jgi:hypothetical protein
VRQLAPLLIVAATACSSEPAQHFGKAESRVIYDRESRVAPSALASPAARDVLVASALALIPEVFIEQNHTDSIWISAPTPAEVFGVCSSEPGADLPAAAVCTGVAVAADVVVTAAHCVVNQEQCDSLRLVRGFLWDSWQQQVPAESVFKCTSILFRRYHDCSQTDLALIEVDRPLAAVADLAQAVSKPGESVTACGASLGAPIRCDPDAIVTANGDSELRLSADVAVGASGGPVLNGNGDLLGVLTGGAKDFSTLGECSVEATITGVGIERAESADAIRFALSQVGRGSASDQLGSRPETHVCTNSGGAVPHCAAVPRCESPAMGWWLSWVAALLAVCNARRRPNTHARGSFGGRVQAFATRSSRSFQRSNI